MHHAVIKIIIYILIFNLYLVVSKKNKVEVDWKFVVNYYTHKFQFCIGSHCEHPKDLPITRLICSEWEFHVETWY